MPDLDPPLPSPVAAFVNTIGAYSVKHGNMQTMIFFHGNKIGGFNRQLQHWYLLTKFVGDDRSKIVRGHGFDLIQQTETRFYWKLDGAEKMDNFRGAVTAITGIAL